MNIGFFFGKLLPNKFLTVLPLHVNVKKNLNTWRIGQIMHIRPQAESLSGMPQPNFTAYKPAPIIAKRAPTPTDTGYPFGQDWIDKVGGNAYELINVVAGSANWNLSAAVSGPLNTLTGDNGGAISPSANNITLAGTTNEITTTGSGSTITWSIPSTFIAPGSIASTTTLTAGSSLSVTTSATIGTTLGVTGATTLAALTAVGTTNINASGSAVTTIGTGGTGAVHIGNTSGNTQVTGSLTASTTLTATLGAITATNGNLNLATAGNKILINATSNATCSAGTFVLGGAATTVVDNSAVTANSLIFLQTAALGTVSAASTFAITAKSPGVSFTVTPSQSTDTSTVNYLIIN